MSEKLMSEKEDIDVIWGTIITHFDGIKEGLEKVKEINGELSTKDHQLTIIQVVKKIYEVM